MSEPRTDLDALINRLNDDSETLSGMAEADRELAPFSTGNKNSITLGITAALEQSSADCREAATQLTRLAAIPSDTEAVTAFETYAADVRYKASDHPRMQWLLTRVLAEFVRNRTSGNNKGEPSA